MIQPGETEQEFPLHTSGAVAGKEELTKQDPAMSCSVNENLLQTNQKTDASMSHSFRIGDWILDAAFVLSQENLNCYSFAGLCNSEEIAQFEYLVIKVILIDQSELASNFPLMMIERMNEFEVIEV